MIPAWAVGITTAPCVCFPSGELAQSLIFDLWRGRKCIYAGYVKTYIVGAKNVFAKFCQHLPTIL